MISSPGRLVEVAGRLVGQQQVGLGDQGPGDGRPLHLAAGQLARAVLQPMAQADQFQQFARPARRAAGDGESSSRRRRRSSAARARFPASSARAAGGRTGRSCRTAGCAGDRGWRPADCRSAGRRSGFRPGRARRACPAGASSVLLPEPLWPTIDRNSPASDVEVDAAQHGHLDAALAVALVQVDGRQLQPRPPACRAAVVGRRRVDGAVSDCRSAAGGSRDVCVVEMRYS